MPWMNFDLQDGKAPIGFNLKPDDCERFMEFLAECQALKESSGSADKRPYDEAVEALRKAVVALPRYSFLLNSGGGVSRVEDRTGRWIELDEAHKLFDPEMVDWLLAKTHAAAAVAKAARPAADNL